MGSSCWIEGMYGMEYNFKIVKGFRIFIEKGMVNDYWVVCVFWKQVCLGCNMTVG